ncbi:hypothetical protein EON63_14755 [archaeon]|nr:MAG: hypothetical protein EON63_14755 [archaeon]
MLSTCSRLRKKGGEGWVKGGRAVHHTHTVYPNIKQHTHHTHNIRMHQMPYIPHTSYHTPKHHTCR